MSGSSLPRRTRRALGRAFAVWPFGAKHRCCLCGHRLRRFLPYRDGAAGLPAVAVEQDIVGSDVETFECPVCGCHDRERHLFLYLRACRLLPKLQGARVLHFAPERRLQRVIAAAGPAEYVRADLFPRHAGVRKIDLTDIAFEADRFDMVIANHVLEHVADDALALREILRVLRPGGHAILQTPFSGKLEAKFEDRRIAAADQRLAAYGQEDHCRLYGADIARYIAAFGFVDRTATHADCLPDVDPEEAGVNAREPLLLFSKPEAE